MNISLDTLAWLFMTMIMMVCLAAVVPLFIKKKDIPGPNVWRKLR